MGNVIFDLATLAIRTSCQKKKRIRNEYKLSDQNALRKEIEESNRQKISTAFYGVNSATKYCLGFNC